MAIGNLEAVEKSLGLEAGKLSEMITSEETHNVELDNLVIFSKDDYDARINNIKKETSFNAVEVAIKNARNEIGLEFQGKTMENLLKSYKEKIEKESTIEPEKRFSDLKTNFEKLQEVNQGLESKYNDLESNIKKQNQTRVINETLLKEIPDNVAIPKEDILAIMKSKYEFNIGEDGFEIIEGNTLLKNETTRNNMKPDEFLKTFIKPYLKEVEGGRGKSDEKGKPKDGTFEAWDSQAKEQGLSGQEYSFALQKAIADGVVKI
jgi:uridine kinase